MIEKIDGLPAGVDGYRLVGTITKDDYEEVMIPWVRGLYESGADVRAVFVIGADFDGYETGAAWEDAMLGLRMDTTERAIWKRVAIVTDTRWIRHLASVFHWMMPGELEVFEMGRLDEAEAWAAA